MDKVISNLGKSDEKIIDEATTSLDEAAKEIISLRSQLSKMEEAFKLACKHISEKVSCPQCPHSITLVCKESASCSIAHSKYFKALAGKVEEAQKGTE